VYNIGGDNEKANIDVARTLLKEMGIVASAGSEAKAEADNITYVSDRPFNDLRYPLDCSKLAALGWTEEVSWEAGLRETLAWYETNSGNWGSIETAIVAHPRHGLLASEMMEGKAPAKTITDDETGVVAVAGSVATA
jgi:dTDP-D-glucose 4,6-dehydratase